MPDNTKVFPPAAQDLIRRLEKKEARIGVIGLGYVGLPLAVVLAEAGFQVYGLDADPEKVQQLRRGTSYIPDVEDAAVAALVESGALIPCSGVEELKGVDAVSICVPTPLRKTGDPDLSYILRASDTLLEILHESMVVILESTTYPGTTREVLQPRLESTGLAVGEEVFLAFSPERVDPGREDWTTKNTPKVIGGITPVCTEVAAAFYEQAIDTVIRTSSTEVAEMTKLLENTFRAVNIGLVNELAIMCDRLGIDVWEVIDAASSKPFGFMKFTPGPGLGGHCIPIDPIYLSWKLKSVKYNARFIELASEINTNMPRYVIGRLQETLNGFRKSVKGTKVLILGVAYKPGVSDTRESPALDLIGLLHEMGGDVRYFDPYVSGLDQDDIQLTSEKDLAGVVDWADCVVIVTDHPRVDYKLVVERAKLIFDTRNALGQLGIRDEKIVRL
jgi:UDP-N-acetyl-D-glucosamine dehydrogenase